MGSEILVKEWGKLSLKSEEEETSVDVDGAAALDIVKRLEVSLVGKLLLKRNINNEVLINVLKNVWRIDGEFGVQTLRA